MGLRDRLLGRESKSTSSSSSAQKAPPVPNASKPQISNKINAVYYPNWRVYRQQPPSSMNLRHITHIFYAFAWVKPDGTVYVTNPLPPHHHQIVLKHQRTRPQLSDEYADTQIPIPSTNTSGCLADLLHSKRHHPHLRTVLSIGGGGDGTTTQGSGSSFAIATAAPSSRSRFASTARALCDRYGFDGVDVDWEHPSSSAEGVAYLSLLSTLRQPEGFPVAQGWLLTSALPASAAGGEWGVLRHIDLAAAGQLLDWINLMAYDFAGPWTDAAGHHAQLWTPPRPHAQDAVVSGERAVEYFVARGVDRGKVVLGVPCYGRVFKGAKGPGDAFGKVGEEEGGVVEYREVVRRGADVLWDAKVGAAWCVDGEGWISLDDARCVTAKGGL